MGLAGESALRALGDVAQEVSEISQPRRELLEVVLVHDEWTLLPAPAREDRRRGIGSAGALLARQRDGAAPFGFFGLQLLTVARPFFRGVEPELCEIPIVPRDSFVPLLLVFRQLRLSSDNFAIPPK